MSPSHPPYLPPQGAPTPTPARLQRPRTGRLVGGVAAGLALHLTLPVRVVRLAFLVAAIFSGAGVVAYLFLWALTPEAPVGDPTSESSPVPPPRTEARHTGRHGWLSGDRGKSRVAVLRGSTVPGGSTAHGGSRVPGETALEGETMRNLGVGAVLMIIGVSLVSQRYGINLRLGFLLPMMAIGLGAVLAWSQLDDTQRGRWLTAHGADRRQGVLRLVAGMILASGGLIVLATQGRGLADLWNVAIAAIAVLGGAGLIAAPWAVRLWNDLRDEQAQRVRETERADIAAHLHDSVLQTLALIQRKADDPAEVARLARAQERELRGWLYDGPRGSQSTLASAVTEAAHEVEDLNGVPIELVVTGDRPLDEAGVALTRALREALLNAGRHGAPPVSAYVEIGSQPAGVEAFVRDHGSGFDLSTMPADRLGVRESIIGRMHRHGGTATLRRLDDGTEVAMTLPATAHAAASGSATSPPVQPVPVPVPEEAVS